MKSKLLLISIFSFSITNVAFSQDDSKLIKDKELTITIGPSATKIKNKNIKNDQYKIIDNKNGFNLEFAFSKYFKNRFGIGVGLGYSSYNQDINQNGLFERSNQVDKDGNDYDLLIKSDMNYTNRLNYFDIPITLHVILGNSKRFYGFIDAGILNEFLISGKYTANGTIENMGKYPTNSSYFNLVSQNNTYYDYKQQTFADNDDEKYKFYNLSGRFSIGLSAAMTDLLYLRVQPVLTVGFSDIMGADGKGQDYKNLFGDKTEYAETKLFSMGLNVGFGFNF